MAKGQFVLNIGDDNVVLVRLADKKVVNAWLGSADPAMAQEELGEALAEDPKAKLSVIIDTLDQAVKEEEVPKVGVLDRRKVLARHINMAFPGMNLRGARMIDETAKKTLLYQFASVPLDGRIPGWMDFIQSLPHPSGGTYTLATENVDIIQALAQKDLPPLEEGKNHWRHLIGVNVTGGLRQIIEKNGRLSLTRLTQAPPPETPPGDFADMIVRDFKATITYIRRLGYQVGEPLDLVVLTTPENKAALEDLHWEGARSVSFYTPYEAGVILGLGSIGREDQAYCDVLHAAWFANKRQPILPLTRSAALGDTKDDLRELAYAASPYAAAVLTAFAIGWSAWTLYNLFDFNARNMAMQQQAVQLKAALSEETAKLAALPYTADSVRNVLSVNEALETGKIDIVPFLQKLNTALQGDAVVTDLILQVGANNATPMSNSRSGTPGAPAAGNVILSAMMRLPSVITAADEAVRIARLLETRIIQSFGSAYKVEMVSEPVAAQAAEAFSGTLLSDAGGTDAETRSVRTDEPFNIEFRISGSIQ